MARGDESAVRLPFFDKFGYFRVERYGYVIECTGCVRDSDGNVIAVHATYFDDSKSGSPGADTYKVKGNLHWVSAAHSVPIEVRLYDKLFTIPDATGEKDGEDYKDYLNPASLQILSSCRAEPGLAAARPGDRYQFERQGYFCVDGKDAAPGKPVFNLTVTLRDTWAKIEKSISS
mgnify:CR=1 FL=1